MKKLNLREIQEIELEILKDFKRVCEKNSLSYSLGYGTLLGAIRHQGFIPWDDDIDVYMVRTDYEKLLDIYNKDKGKDEYEISSYNTEEKLNIPFAKIVDKKTFTSTPIGGDPNVYGHLWIDIFPVDYLPKNKISRLFLIFLEKMFISWIGMANDNWSNKRGFINSINKAFALFYRKIGSNKLSALVDRIAIKSNEKSKKKKGNKFLGCLVWSEGEKETLKEEEFESYFFVTFEGEEFSSIKYPKEYLKKYYGEDFMSLPPESKRVWHLIDAWIE